MVKRNPNFAKLPAGYLFPEIAKRKNAFLKRNPHVQLISLGIGDTTLPISEYVSDHLASYAKGLGTLAGYSGYGPEQGQPELRQRIANVLYEDNVAAEEIFVSDGAKCDIGRLQVLFGSNATIAVQDPIYPVYLDTGVMVGQSGDYARDTARYAGIQYMPCTPENNFFPDLSTLPRTDLIYFCSPNNPTGATANKQQLTELVNFAKRNRSIIIFDAAYAAYIQDPTLPKSIYEIEGAREVAIEIGSFSKMAGFTGLRLGWSVVPSTLTFDDGTPVRKDWERMHTTFFNGASNIVQRGALAVLDEQGLQGVEEMVKTYLENARLISHGLKEMGIIAYGGENAPYIWADFGRPSWEIFEELLENAHVVTTPGSGFGSAGEGFLRLSPFASRANVIEGVNRLQNYLSNSIINRR